MHSQVRCAVHISNVSSCLHACSDTDWTALPQAILSQIFQAIPEEHYVEAASAVGKARRQPKVTFRTMCKDWRKAAGEC